MSVEKWLLAKFKGDTLDGKAEIVGNEVFEFDTTKWSPIEIVKWIIKQHPIDEDTLDVTVHEMDWITEDDE